MGFGAHDPRHGARLGRQQALGPSGLLRQIVDRGPGSPPAASGPAPSAAAAVAARRPEGRVLTASNVEKKNDVGPRKTGRPGLGEPWKALKISRAVYFRRKAAGAL